ncbi:MAG TPA: metallophosphoesterase [Actinomycetota bacterium]
MARSQVAADGGDVRRPALAGHPLVRGATSHVEAHKRGNDFRHHPVQWIEHEVGNDVLGLISQIHWEHAEAKRHSDSSRLTKLADEIERLRRLSNWDPGWVECEVMYLTFWAETGGHIIYRDWTKEGNNDQDYSVIAYRLPNDARVAILGDWGTGMQDAKGLLTEVMAEHHPAAILHLGDVYYSGTPEECTRHIAGICNQVFETYGRVPVFTIPGNHDYYDWGSGFYQLIDGPLNPPSEPSWRQQASYFCLRTEDGRWQFLAMDTARSEAEPLAGMNPAAATLAESETVWLADKLDPSRFSGSTVLLSHHQVFSAHVKVDVPPGKPYLNEGLLDVFRPHLGRVAAWFWGHEHSLWLFRNGLFGLAKGRLVGASAYESSHDENPYGRTFEEVGPQLFDGRPAQVGTTDDFYNHSYAIVDLTRADPGDPIQVTYSQIPSWTGDEAKSLPAEQKMVATETLQAPVAGS